MSKLTALVIRSYHCRESERFAYWLAERFNTERYGHVAVDPNEGFPEAGADWYSAYKALTSNDIYIIAVVTSALSDAIDDETNQSFEGIALLSELLHFVDAGSRDDERPNPSFLIPVVLDCNLDDLVRPSGRHEQLQDIAVPLLKTANPLFVTTEKLYESGHEMYRVADAIAIRMNVEIKKDAK